MRKLHWRLARLNLMSFRAASVALAVASVTYATPVFAQAPAMMSADGPMAIGQQQCIDVAKSVIVALGGTETAANEKSRAMTRGHFVTSIECFIPGRLMVVVAGPAGTDPEPELDAVLAAFVSGVMGKGTGRPPPPPAGQMPALPTTYGEAWSMSQPINRSFLVGRWTDNGNCNPASVEFKNDGIYTMYDGGWSRWTLEGDTLSMGSSQMKVRGNGRNRLFHFIDGKFGQSIRC